MTDSPSAAPLRRMTSVSRELLDGQRWLFVEDSPFIPARDGGQREHLGMLRAAKEAGVLAGVVLPCDQTIDLHDYGRELGVPVVISARRRSPVLLLHPFRPWVVASRPTDKDLVWRVRNAVPGLTGIVVSTYKSWMIGRDLAAALKLPAVLRQHNRESEYFRSLAREIKGARGVVYRWESMRISADEKRLAGQEWLRGTADISMADAAWRRRQGVRNVEFVPPFAISVDHQLPLERPRVGSPRALFLGSLDVPTNQTALRWLLDAVWPLVVRQRPDVVLSVVGSRPPAALARDLRSAPGVDLSVDVPDVGPYLDAAWVALNPAVAGSGVNIKIVEYMAAGLPVVSTSSATRALALRPGLDLRVHDEAPAFARAVVDLLDRPDVAGQMALVGRERLAELLDSRANLAKVAALMHQE